MAGNLHVQATISPSYIEAKSAQELERLMLENNLKNNKQFNYQIVTMGTKFYAWFDKDHKDNIKLRARGEK